MTNNDRVVVLAEKPDAARKIAQALSCDGRGLNEVRGVIHLTPGYDSTDYVIFSAVGHLYQLVDVQEKRQLFPVLDMEWIPRTRRTRSRRHTSSASSPNSMVDFKLEQISQALSESSKLVNACDYDTEGETIGYNILVLSPGFGSGTRKMLRAKFSTLTTEEIRDSFRRLHRPDPNLAKAGRLRHVADFTWGVNFSRALANGSDLVGHGTFTNLTIGRVQGPTLAFVVERELERRTHVPVPSWKITCILAKRDRKSAAHYLDSPIRKHQLAIEIEKAASTAGVATVKRIERLTQSVPPRYPFDLHSLQEDAYRFFKLSPKTTLSTAQKLYQDALISYPRTDSQKLPEKIGAQEILKKLLKNPAYSKLISRLKSDPKARERPREGPRDDTAHPAIYPTGEVPKGNLGSAERKIYDLITRRFCNTFASNLIIEKTKVVFDVSSFDFIIEGSVIIEEGWTAYYPFGRRLADALSVTFEEGERLPITSVSLVQEFDPMPSRFSEGSLLSQMEKENIGTKATRADIISTLIERKYVEKANLELVPTSRGTSLVEYLEISSPEIISTKMTRKLEESLDLIRSGKELDVDFVAQLLSSLRPSLKQMLHTNIESELSESVESSRGVSRIEVLGSCPACKQGMLQLITSPKTKKRFIRCTNFGNRCDSSSPAFPRGSINPTEGSCQNCGWPLVLVETKFGSNRKICPNYYCTSKKVFS